MIVTSERQLKELLDIYLEFDSWSFDVETLAGRGPWHDKDTPQLDWRTNVVFWLSLAGPGRADVIPMGHEKGRLLTPERSEMRQVEGLLTASGKPSKRKVKHVIPAVWIPAPEQLDRQLVFDTLEPLFFSDAEKTGINLKFDVKSIAKYYGGARIPGPFFDAQIAAKLVNENHQDYRLGTLTKREFGFVYEKLGKKGVENFPFREAATYGYLDSKFAWLLRRLYIDELRHEGVENVFYDIEMPLLEATIDMEMTGAPLDAALMRSFHDELEDELADIQAKIEEFNGGPINLNADRQVADLVYKKRGHKPKVFTDKTNEPSVAAAALEPYEKDPVVKLILTHADNHKLYSTYLHNNIVQVETTGRLYAEFDQLGTKTGRYSSRQPNLTNIPVRSEKGKRVRELFIAPPGYVLVVADFSQVELRVLADQADDPMLKKAYREGLDLHRITAQRAYHVEEPTSEQRGLAKNVNFSVAYLISAKSLVERYKIRSVKEAQHLIDTFYATYRNVEPWQRRVVKEALAKFEKGVSPPYVTTISGRKRRLPELRWADRYLRQKAERQAINTVIQGSAAEITKAAINEYQRRSKGTQHKLIMCVHDELVALSPEDKAEEGRALLQECMEGVNPLTVPLVADAHVVPTWASK